MRMKRRSSNAAPDLRLITSKPQPETLKAEDEALASILERAVIYKRPLCRDCLGGERETETLHLKVTLFGGDNPLSEHIARRKLLSFLTQYLGSPLSEALGDNERLAGALFEAEEERLISIKIQNR